VKHLSLFLILVVITTTSIFSQKAGVLAGKIVDEKTNSILPGVTIAVNPGGKGRISDIEGRYTINLPEGTYTLNFASVGYKPKAISDVVIKSGETVELNVILEQQVKEMQSVVVTSSSPRRESVASVLTLQKNNASISDGISIEAIRKSPDKNIGEVLKRVSGTSIQDDRFVVIRGLTDRYNVALINGAILPSTEPDRRAFSFDIIPSNLIDNILINKTASPDMPGDFSGGVVQIITKDIPFKSFMSATVGVGYNSMSTGKSFNIGLLENTDYLGFDNGTRAFHDKFPSRKAYANYENDASPDRRIQASRLMRNNYGNRYSGNALPTFNFQYNWGGRKDLKNGATIGSVLALVYRNSQTIQQNQRRGYDSQDPSAAPVFDYNDSTYSFTSNIGVLANFAYKKGNNKIVFKNILNRLFDNNNLIRTGPNGDNDQFFQTTGSVTVIKSMISSQLEGEHLVSNRNDRLKWNVNYALTAQNQPDYRVLPYSKNISEVDNKAVPFSFVWKDSYRFWSDLYDNAFGGNINYTLPLTFGNQKQQLKAGLLGQYKIRDFKTRIFRYEPATSRFNQELLILPPRIILNDGNIYDEGFVLDEITNNSDKYDATSGLYAGYAMIDGRIGEKLRAVYGLRVENFNFHVNTGSFSSPKVEIDRNYIDILPSVNLTYNLSKESNLRFSASRTVSRPELREVANFSYYNFILNAQIQGNPELERSQNTNLDFRFETYPEAGEIISASLFYKHFKSPIEQTVVPGSSGNSMRFTFENPDAARTYGVEVEIRKKLGFLGKAPWLDDLVFNLNGAVMKSKVDLDAGDNFWVSNRPMQGQSPWLINAGLLYALPDNKVSFSALVNRIGHRIAYVGSEDIADIYENGRTLLDFQTALKVLKNKAEVKLNVSDLLNQRSVFFQNPDKTGKETSYNSSKDRINYSYLYGRNVSISFTYNFK
jgi:TonB-dependent receptor